jgi:hypothetical protein
MSRISLLVRNNVIGDKSDFAGYTVRSEFIVIRKQGNINKRQVNSFLIRHYLL